MSAKSSGTTSMATISAPASSARLASSGPERSSASRRETLLEMVMTTVRTGPDDSRAAPRPPDGYGRTVPGMISTAMKFVATVGVLASLALAAPAGAAPLTRHELPAECRDAGGEYVVALACDPERRAAQTHLRLG